MQSDGREYTGAGGIQFRIWPGSGVAKGKSKPAWILAAEIVETGQRYGRTVAQIDPDWIEPLALHLVRRSYSEPHWSKKRQSATAYEKVSLFGLPIVVRRPVRYGAIDPAHARELLIEKGLVEDQMRSEPPFLIHNRNVLAEMQTLAAKTRQRDFVIDDYAVRNFYNSRLPLEAVDGGTLAGLLKAHPGLDRQLRFSVTDLLPQDAPDVNPGDFPEILEVGELRLPVRYNFAPGTEDDGVNVQVPPEAVARIHENQLGWSVPGLLRSRIVALIRSLPKTVRRQLVPAPETADKIAAQIEFGAGSFWDVIAGHLTRIAGEPVTPEMFRLEKLDDSLKINLQVRDEAGQVIAQGRTLSELKSRLPNSGAAASIDLAGHDAWHRDDVRQWDWDTIPPQVVLQRGGVDVPLFPAVIDRGDHVQLRLLDHAATAEQATRQGLATLYRIVNRKLIRSQVKWLPLDPLLRAGFQQSLLRYASEWAEPESARSCDLDEQLAQLIAVIAFTDESCPRSTDEFAARNRDAAMRIGMATQQIAGWLPQILEWHHRVELQLQQLPGRFAQAVEDIQSQLRFLLGRKPLSNIPAGWLEHYPRYLQAILVRLDRLSGGGLEKDRQQTAVLGPFVDRWERARQQPEFDPQLEQFGWLLQEFRVSLFAQQLGTCETVSPQRLERQWKRVDRPV